MGENTTQRRGEDGLLHQDRAVMELLLQGKGRQDICQMLGMPRGTLNTCCNRIYKQMGVKSVVELIIKCRSG